MRESFGAQILLEVKTGLDTFVVESSTGLIITHLPPEWSLQAIGLSGGHGFEHLWSLSAVIAYASLRMPLHRKYESSRLIYTIRETGVLDKNI